ncbi:DNA translocase FtsK [Lactiplantibacillus pentosus]|uniref:DNA translocase FtsK n=1 Tax=Lactiplantibacillus pentosus TaxID=1589 RepID=UPI000B53D1A0|nr:DNA translocase FtsK [Lactiplantibacillus pentosus]ASG78652.1 cell division protein FtsK [Lactiplantibacillus pentosus]MDO7804442.1 DNA translocase FtsK [Lactiplantibacillus pentosus]
MNHYDGPAFFRKYRYNQRQMNNSAASQSTPTAVSASSQAASSAASAVETPARAASPVRSSSAGADTTTLFNGGTHGDFHPSRVPAQLTSALTNGGIIQDNDDRNYLEIQASLHKRPESFLLFADETTADLPLVDLQAPQTSASSFSQTPLSQAPSNKADSAMSNEPTRQSMAATSANASEATATAEQSAVASQATVATASVAPTEVFEPSDPELAASAAAINQSRAAESQVARPTEIFEPSDPELAASAAAVNQSHVAEPQVARPTEVFEPSDPELAASAAALNQPHVTEPQAARPTEVFEPSDPELAASAAQVNAQSADSTTDAASESAAAKPAHGLGLSLGDIMTAEHDAQADLALFKDQSTSSEAAAPVSSAAKTSDADRLVSAAADSATQESEVTDQHSSEVTEYSEVPVGSEASDESDDFNGQAQAKSNTEAGSQSTDSITHNNESGGASTAPRSQAPQPDELYQPVGMRPASSTAVTPVSTTASATTSATSVHQSHADTTTGNRPAPSTAATSAVTAPTPHATVEQTSDEDQPELVHSGESAAPVLEDKELAAYHLPPLNLLKAPIVPNESEMDDWIEQKASALDESLDAFGVNANVVDWTIGPTVTQFQVKLARGVKVSKITNLNDDLKLALAAKDIRIEAPIPGRNTVGIEIPNMKSRPVMLSEVLDTDKFRQSKSPLTVALGVDLFGKPQVTDLRKMPHGLIAGATGSGKSVFINSILVSILYKANPQQVKLLLIDPKAVELAPYNEIPHLLAPVISEPKAASAALKWVVDEMDNRYDKLAAGGARNIEQFNQLAEEHHEPGLKMPYIVIVIDELADLMMVASSEVQDYIARITQKARAAGIHLLVATQRPSVDVVTGLIKNNIPTRVAFMVASQIDSRTILDSSGAERLLGRGDMLYLGNGQSNAVRLQGTFVDSEIDSITQFVRDQAAPHYEFQPDSLLKHEEAARNEDDLMPEALAYIANEDTMSTSKLQRNFSIGYNRAANIIDDLENRGYVSAAKGSKPRDVYFTADDLTKLQANS